MKSEFLKIAGVKSDKAFYKKYPTEAAFFKAHPEAKKSIKKAQAGISAMSSFAQSMQNIPDMQTMMQGQMQSPGVNASMFPSGNQPQTSGPMNAPGSYNSWDIDNNGVSDIMQGPEGNPLNNNSKQSQGATPAKPNFGDQLSKMAGPAGQIIGGIQAIKEGKKKRKEAEMWAKVTGLQAQAAESTDVDDLRQYTENAERKRRAFMPEMTGEEFFPIYGVGTNVLARNGARLEDGGMVGGNPTEIQNTYGDGNSLYDNLEYEPLYNIDQVKSYRMGGYLPKAFDGAAMSGMMSSMGGGAGGGTPWGAIGGLGSQGAASLTGNDGGGQVGGAIGGAAGMALGGPAGQAIGQIAGTAIGGLIDTNDRDQRKAEEKTKNHIDRMITSQFTTDYLHPKFGANLRDGGYMNPEYNPQVITMFGDVNDEDFADYAKKDQFRAGGHLKAYREPSERAMQTYAMGGELKTHWGGYAEPISENPYLPGSGETVMFRGKSHDESDGKGNTGIGITYGDNPVEVERGEPATKLRDGSSGEESLVVYGNLKISKDAAKFIGDEKAEGMKYKNYIADKSKFETKQNKLIQKSTEELGNFDPKDAYDKLKAAGLEAKILGGKMNLKEVAKIKEKSAFSQNTINETAEKYGLVADDLARGKVKIDKEAMSTRQARLGAAISKAKDGITTTTEQTTIKPAEFTSKEAAIKAGFVQNAKGEWYKPKEGKKKTVTEKKSASAMDNIPKQSVDKATGLFGDVTPEQFKAYKEKNKWFTKWDTFDPNDENDVDEYAKAFNAEAEKRGSKARILPDVEYDPKTKKSVPGTKTKYVGKQFTSANIEDVREEEPGAEAQEYAMINEPDTEAIPYKRSGLLDFAGQLLPFIRPTDQEELNPRQLMGELYAMSSNQVEPVQAQPYSPQLRVPFDISRQAAKNDLIAQTRAAQRLVGYNPAAQASIAAGAYNPMQQLNEQDFVDNQRMKDAVYSGNINTLNDAELQNLAIYDQQYERQAQALSNTKATAQAALNSISDKYAKNALENRTLGVYENLYNYRYDNRGRAINMNAPFQPNIPTIGSVAGTQKQVPVKDADGNILYYQLEQEDGNRRKPSMAGPGIVTKNGKSISKKNNKNSSIVKAIKNL
jgi:hypothetical protein